LDLFLQFAGAAITAPTMVMFTSGFYTYSNTAGTMQVVMQVAYPSCVMNVTQPTDVNDGMSKWDKLYE
jgi:hypothetical protein